MHKMHKICVIYVRHSKLARSKAKRWTLRRSTIQLIHQRDTCKINENVVQIIPIQLSHPCQTLWLRKRPEVDCKLCVTPFTMVFCYTLHESYFECVIGNVMLGHNFRLRMSPINEPENWTLICQRQRGKHYVCRSFLLFLTQISKIYTTKYTLIGLRRR